MSGDALLFALTAVLLPYRLVPARVRAPAALLIRAALQAAAIVPLLAWGRGWPLALAMIAVIGASDFLLRRRDGYARETVALAVRLAAVLLVPGNPRLVAGFSAFAGDLLSFAQANSTLAAALGPPQLRMFLLLSSGVLLAGFEINCVVALILKQSHLMPGADGRRRSGAAGAAAAAKQLARGRLIGILERSITFALTVTGNLPSVALVLAAKAVARFQDLDDRDFAEYVVIGTLLSISFAAAAAFVLQAI